MAEAGCMNDDGMIEWCCMYVCMCVCCAVQCASKHPCAKQVCKMHGCWRCVSTPFAIGQGKSYCWQLRRPWRARPDSRPCGSYLQVACGWGYKYTWPTDRCCHASRAKHKADKLLTGTLAYVKPPCISLDCSRQVRQRVASRSPFFSPHGPEIARRFRPTTRRGRVLCCSCCVLLYVCV